MNNPTAGEYRAIGLDLQGASGAEAARLQSRIEATKASLESADQTIIDGLSKHDYRWSSVHAHLSGKDSQGIIQPEKLLSLAGDWKTYLKEAQVNTGDEFERHERTGRPLGKENFIEKAERLL